MTADSADLIATSAYSAAPVLSFVPERFEHLARENPSGKAVLFGDETLTYGELDSISRRVASRLLLAGCHSKRVGVLCHRSLLLPACVLGVFRSGAVYLPLDYASPSERLTCIVSDACPDVIIVQRALLEVARHLNDGLRFFILEDLITESEQDTLDLPPISSATPAYLIYTSGSTGVPKGVLIEHGSLANFLNQVALELNVSAGHRVFAMASVAFDVSIFEIFLPLYAGACTVILPRHSVAQPEALICAIAKYKPRIVAATPSTWEMLRHAGWEGEGALIAISGAESLGSSLAAFLLSRTEALWNHYGPTETTIAATTYKVNGNERQIPLGCPVPGYHLQVTDDAGLPVPEGQQGELCIGGCGLATGYWNRPEETTARFVFLSDPRGIRSRYYRTGDLVRVDANGDLLFLGRTDNQVKIRGVRLELEEVETLLQQHPAIRVASAICKRFGENDNRLAIYFVRRGEAAAGTDELRSFLRRKLPAYMIPSLFIERAELPTNMNGKVDRKLLQSQPLEMPDISESDISISDGLEKKLLRLWRQLPGFNGISSTDDFFALGGHSLLAAELIKQINNDLRLRLPLSVLFEAPTVRELAEHVRAGKHKTFSNLVAIRAEGDRTPLFCVHGIEGNVLCFERLGLYLKRGRPVYALQAPGLDSSRIPPFSISGLAKAYMAQVKTAQPRGPYLFGGYSSGGLIAFEMARHAMSEGDEVSKLFLFDAPMLVPGGPNETGTERKLRKAANRLRRFLSKSLGDQWKAFRRNSAIAFNVWSQRKRSRAGLPLKPFRKFLSAFAFALDSYVPQPLSIDAVLFVPEHGLQAGMSDPQMGWRDMLRSTVVVDCTGDHASMFFDPHVKSLCESIDKTISDHKDAAFLQTAC